MCTGSIAALYQGLTFRQISTTIAKPQCPVYVILHAQLPMGDNIESRSRSANARLYVGDLVSTSTSNAELWLTDLFGPPPPPPPLPPPPPPLPYTDLFGPCPPLGPLPW